MPQIPASYDFECWQLADESFAVLRHRETDIGISFPINHWPQCTAAEKQEDIQAAIDEIFPAIMERSGFIIEAV